MLFPPLESNIYRDLVQYDFHDTDTNSTLKLALAYTWLSQYCNSALYMMLAHDDVSVDVYKLTTYLHSLRYGETNIAIIKYK